MKNKNLRISVFSALFAAVTAVLSQLVIPTGIVPVSLSLISVYISSALLGCVWGTASILLYIALGCVGLPVFAGFSSFSAITGPTGGYIVGYLFCAAAVGFIANAKNTLPSMKRLCFAMLCGLFLCYAFGTVWYCLYAKIGIEAALSVCVIPFLPFDAVKIILSAFLVKRLKPAFNAGVLSKNMPKA